MPAQVTASSRPVYAQGRKKALSGTVGGKPARYNSRTGLVHIGEPTGKGKVTRRNPYGLRRQSVGVLTGTMTVRGAYANVGMVRGSTTAGKGVAKANRAYARLTPQQQRRVLRAGKGRYYAKVTAGAFATGRNYGAMQYGMQRAQSRRVARYAKANKRAKGGGGRRGGRQRRDSRGRFA